MKTPQARFDDTLAYLAERIDRPLAAQVKELARGLEATLGAELHLGPRWDLLSSAAVQQTHTEQRRALRALLLCQRIYFSDLWPSMIGTVAARTAVNWLPTDWKDRSCTIWASRSENDLRDALRSYVATTDSADMVANAAAGWRPAPPPSPPYLDVTRASFGGPRLTDTCYDAVMLWLFKSGLVSLRWLLRHRNANTADTLTEAFGPGLPIWNGAFGAADRLPNVPRGHIVHIYENPASWRGHWMVSLGNGRAAGVNNNEEEPPVPRDHCTTLTLDKQFRDYGGGTAVVINPMSIPGRL